MKISSAVLNFFNNSIFIEQKKEKLLDLMTWIFFRISLLWDPMQREEYRQFYEIKRLCLLENTPETTKIFKEKVLILCGKISDELITQHIKRLNNGQLGSQPYFYTFGDEKACIKAHEVFEMLSMKWESGLPFDRERFSMFWPAHEQAIRVENIFLQALALEKKISLSKKALEYCRIVDGAPSFPIKTTYSTSKNIEILNLIDTEVNLTKKIDAIPLDPNEIDAYCDFFSQFMNDWSPNYKIGLCQRYLFSRLSKNYPDKKLYLLTLLRALEIDGVYHKFPLKTTLAKLEDHLQNFNLPQHWSEEEILKAADFFCRDDGYMPFEIREHYNCLYSKIKQ